MSMSILIRQRVRAGDERSRVRDRLAIAGGVEAEVLLIREGNLSATIKRLDREIAAKQAASRGNARV